MNALSMGFQDVGLLGAEMQHLRPLKLVAGHVWGTACLACRAHLHHHNTLVSGTISDMIHHNLLAVGLMV